MTGRLSRRRLPTKVGQPTPDWSWVGVVVPDQAGELARLFDAVGEWGINVEDVRVEHSHEQRRGTAELAVNPAAARVAHSSGCARPGGALTSGNEWLSARTDSLTRPPISSAGLIHGVVV